MVFVCNAPQVSRCAEDLAMHGLPRRLERVCYRGATQFLIIMRIICQAVSVRYAFVVIVPVPIDFVHSMV